jgi:uncharacterized protein
MRVLLLSLLCLISACASQADIRLYEGPTRPAAQLVEIEVPAELEILTINERRIERANRIFSMHPRTLQLEPGNYRIVAFYKDIFEVPPSGHEVVRSDPTLFRIDGAAGSRYRLGFDAPADLDAAKQMARNFTGWHLNLDSGEQHPGIATGLTHHGLLGGITANQAPMSSTRAVPDAAAGLDQLDLLKAIWRNANDEERRLFLRWIAEQP